MLLPISFKADWAAINARKQLEINRNNARENKKRIPHEYHVGDRVLLKLPKRQWKHCKDHEGSSMIEQVNTNGTICIQRKNISDLVNIRCVTLTLKTEAQLGKHLH